MTVIVTRPGAMSVKRRRRTADVASTETDALARQGRTSTSTPGDSTAPAHPVAGGFDELPGDDPGGAPDRLGAELPIRHVPVVVVGAGQAGLSASWYLTEKGIEHLVLESSTIAHTWRTSRWDSFVMVTPRRQCRLPGFAYRGPDPDGFMTREDVEHYLAAYTRVLDPPVREHTTVRSARPLAGGGFRLLVQGRDDQLEALRCERLIVATGRCQSVAVPRCAERLPGRIQQYRSTDYRNPASLPEGAVLVVGSGQSGTQIAEDLLLGGRQVHLALGSSVRAPRRYRGRDTLSWLEDMAYFALIAERQPGDLPVQCRRSPYMNGRDPARDLDLRALARDGVRLHGRLVDVHAGAVRLTRTVSESLDRADVAANGMKDRIDAHIARQGLEVPAEERRPPVWQPTEEPTDGSTGPPGGARQPLEVLDLDSAGIGSVIWATGFRTDYRWLHAPVFDGECRPCHYRGVTATRGLYFLGLPWQHTWGSERMAGIAVDAAFVVDHLAAHTPPTELAAQPRRISGRQ